MNKKSSINNVHIIPIKGPWITKSSGTLDVISALNFSETTDFFQYDSKVDENIRGLRIYRVSNLQKGTVGGAEWHKIKKELVFITKGCVQWNLQDRSGQKEEFILTPKNAALIIPPLTMHTYTTLEDDSEILVITNTLFNPEDPSTHDTYPLDTFPSI